MQDLAGDKETGREDARRSSLLSLASAQSGSRERETATRDPEKGSLASATRSPSSSSIRDSDSGSASEKQQQQEGHAHHQHDHQLRPTHSTGSVAVISRTVSAIRDDIAYQRDLTTDPSSDPESEKNGGAGDAGPPTPSTPRGQGAEEDGAGRRQRQDPNLVTWDGPDDPENPKNWDRGRKWRAVFVVSTFTLISPVSSSMVAPSLVAIGEELGIPGA
ncbi:hypothetical protein F4778DRAFT_614228 [Xylariomycetidae sp. FL2044]|nr:hypothetical protein F4778DRAFT_614228 [Xylariomycetidae sp. FL2044]